MPNHAKCSHPWTVHTSRLLMSQNSIKNVLENLFLMFGRGKTQNRAKTHRPSMSAFSAIFVLKENGTQSHSAKFLNWGDHLNSVPDLAASPPCFQRTSLCNHVNTSSQDGWTNAVLFRITCIYDYRLNLTPLIWATCRCQVPAFNVLLLAGIER